MGKGTILGVALLVLVALGLAMSGALQNVILSVFQQKSVTMSPVKGYESPGIGNLDTNGYRDECNNGNWYSTVELNNACSSSSYCWVTCGGTISANTNWQDVYQEYYFEITSLTDFHPVNYIDMILTFKGCFRTSAYSCEHTGYHADYTTAVEVYNAKRHVWEQYLTEDFGDGVISRYDTLTFHFQDNREFIFDEDYVYSEGGKKYIRIRLNSFGKSTGSGRTIAFHTDYVALRLDYNVVVCNNDENCDEGEDCASCPNDCPPPPGYTCCEGEARKVECTANSECNDGDECTEDRCDTGQCAGVCKHILKPGYTYDAQGNCKPPCLDGTEWGMCSADTPGYYCK